MFWTTQWKYERTPEDWVMHASRRGSNAKQLLFKAVEKLRLEKLVTAEIRDSLVAMLKSDDKENMLLAVILMAKFKPKNSSDDKKS